MRKFNSLIALLLLILTAAGCAEKGKPEEKQIELTVSAAASLQDALNEIASNFEKEHEGIKINYNFGSSGALQQQISQGAPVDAFFSAAADKMDKLEKDGLIEKRTNLVGNELVLVVPKNAQKTIRTFEELEKADKISIGTPESVPAGKYAMETLEHLGVWDAVGGKVVFAKDVRQVLTYVETANVDAGIVYKTDAMASKKVEIAETAGEDSHGPIIYPLGIIKDSRHLKEATEFYEYLIGNESMKVLEKYGFKGL
ncbi:molybdate ABC transporter substrate-binding protein [Neobacillus piezotolerans]|uniref:Molybdate ABC transporter substrate-binding protein n=1 Tax=Neobacillus piezotolerans TaxID=2259171 RepID=A0A3D8GKS3_9BACI|nr:molybdate ABC transporter substrate-binding protein [Neobacillus piezotolerans]RDU34859.1 molybdate ABC transporter substrate-binding protein [Neobacillus piezotolerans]